MSHCIPNMIKPSVVRKEAAAYKSVDFFSYLQMFSSLKKKKKILKVYS